MYEWVFNARQSYGDVLRDGRSIAFLQGDEASALDDLIEECDTAEDVDRVLSAYDY